MLIIAVGLCVAAVAALTWPWRRTGDVTPVEVGYAWRGRRGAVLGAIGVLIAGRLALGGTTTSRLERPLPDELDPLVRAVYDSLVIPRSVRALLAKDAVRAQLPAVARRTVRNGLRVGAFRRMVGSLAAVAAPVVAVLADSVVTAVVTGVVALVLLALRGRTLAGRSVLRQVRQVRPAPQRVSAETSTMSASGLTMSAVAFMAVGGTVATAFMGWGGSDGGGSDGGGGDYGGGDGGGSY